MTAGNPHGMNRSLGEATYWSVRLALRDRDAEIIEWPVFAFTWVLSRKNLVIVRCNSLGADIRNVEGGWAYQNDMAFMLDRLEILRVRENVTKGP